MNFYSQSFYCVTHRAIIIDNKKNESVCLYAIDIYEVIVMNMMPDFANYLAIEILECLDIDTPNQDQISLLAKLVSNVSIKTQIVFDQQLSRRERGCLYWAANGKTSGEIAKIIGVKPSTVHWYKREILRKLDCANLTEAVFVGMRYGQLNQHGSVVCKRASESGQ